MSDGYPMIRKLDGVFYRVERNGRWQSIAFTDLTRLEQEKFLQTLDTEGLKRMCYILSDTIRYIGDQFDIMAGQEGEG